MNKKTVGTVASVVLGIATFVIVSTMITLFFNAIFYKDIILISSVGENEEKTMAYMKHSSIGLICVAVAMLASYFFTYFSKRKKVFAPISAGLSLLMIVMCIAFIFNLRGIVLKFDSSKATCYTVAAEYFSELITLTIATMITCAYFTVVTVLSFTTKKAVQSIAENTESPVENEKNSADKEVPADEKA